MIDKGGILVIDDFIDKDYQEKIKDNLMGDNDFPWFYIDDVTAAYEEGNQGRPGLSHVYVAVSYTHLTLPTICSV